MPSDEPQQLRDQAATAALYSTQGKNKKLHKDNPNYPLDKDGKLSSAGAAASLKHAGPRDLPSFPTVGLPNTDSASGAAASLANAHQKNIEIWQPGEIPAANKAAILAKDYRPDPLWQPELSAAGSKAALLANKKGGSVDIWRPHESPDDAGHSAAGQAMRKEDLSPHIYRGVDKDDEKRALMAATQSMASGRTRAESTPTVTNPAYPDSANSAANALKAATSVNRNGNPQPAPTALTGPQMDMTRIHNQSITNMRREMYTANPPVAPEVEEKNRQATLRASAVAMAKQMYDIQQKRIAEAAELGRSDSQYAAANVHNRPQSSISYDDGRPTPQYANLQEAAQKLAAERLAKLHDEHAAYRTYYGTQQAPQKRLSLRGRPRRRASSDGDLGDDDEERARKIRNQMSLFTGKLDQVDNKKRQKDRESLLAVAQRNVRASLTDMDQKVYNETGKISPAMMEEWEAKAKAKAQAESETRMVNHGRVNIGGGKFLDQSEIDAIAAAKVQPTLDEIAAKAERDRARDEEIRQMQLERERIEREKHMDDKIRADQTKEEWKRFKEEEKREAKAKKDAEKAKKDAEKARKAEEKRLEKERKRKSKEAKATSDTLAVVAEKAKEGTKDEEPVPEHKLESEPLSEQLMVGPVPPPLETEVAKEEAADEEEEEEDVQEEGEEEEEEGEEEEEVEEDTGAPIVPPKPPVLGAIPHVASYSAESKLQPQQEDVERIAPGFLPTSELPPINASQADFTIATADEGKLRYETLEEHKLEKFVTADPEEKPAAGSEAEEIARRVFSSPVDNTTAAPDAEVPEEIEDLVETTADTGVAPVVDVEDNTLPATAGAEAVQAPVEPLNAESATEPSKAPGESTQIGTGSQPVDAGVEPSQATEKPNQIEPEPSKPSGELFPPTKTTAETSQPDKPVADRIAPPVVAAAPKPAQVPAAAPATTETTVSGPGKPSKEKDSGSVSGWLKSKFSRRSSKPSKPESTSSSGPSTLTKAPPGEKKSGEKKVPEKMKEVVPVTGPAGKVVLTEPKGAHSSDVGDSSMREVAMAGKDSKATGAATSTLPAVSPLPDDGPIAHSGAAAHHQRESSEISSLSSDEDTRGRSSVRLADTLGLPPNESHAHDSEAHQLPMNKRAGMVGSDLPASIGQSSTSGGEYEEAKDTFDNDALSPPPAVLPGAEEGRKSSSPARDSKFVEVL